MTKLNKIDQNWNLFINLQKKICSFEHKNKIKTNLTKLYKNWDQKGILTVFNKLNLTYLVHLNNLNYILTSSIIINKFLNNDQF